MTPRAHVVEAGGFRTPVLEAGDTSASEAVVFVHEAIEERDEDAGGGGEEVGGDEACAAKDCGLNEVEARGDVGAGHPEGECFEGDAAGLRDSAQGAGGVCEFIQDLLDGVGMGIEVGHDGGIVAGRVEVSIGFCTVF